MRHHSPSLAEVEQAINRTKERLRELPEMFQGGVTVVSPQTLERESLSKELRRLQALRRRVRRREAGHTSKEVTRLRRDAGQEPGIASTQGEQEAEHVQECTFTHSNDYRSVTFKGTQHTLTSRQAQMIQILHQAHESGNPDVGIDYILEQLGTPNGRWQDTFKSNPGAKKVLIVSGRKRGTLRLNV